MLVIAVEFLDQNHTLTIEQITEHTITRLNDYFGRVSYNAASITGKVVGWVRLPFRMSRYGTDNGPFIDDQDGDSYPDSWQLLKDAAPIVAGEVDLTAYQHVLVLHAGFGQESSRVPSDIWSVTYLHWTVVTKERTFETFAIVPEFEARGLGTLGVNAHEFGHLLGLPDLYSTTVEQVGPWDLMARGAWNGNPAGSSPAEMLAWDRIFLGWISGSRILNVTKNNRVNATVDAIELPSSSLQAVRVQASTGDTKHYYLVEVRQKIGYDAALPSSGVLITYIDETKSTPVKVIDAVQTTSSLIDAPFQVGQKYLDSENSIVISVVSTDGSSFSVIVDTSSPSPDVAVESLTVNPPIVHPNETASLMVRIANEGTLKANGFLVNIFVNETIFAARRISLNSGQAQEILLSWTPKTAGAYVFKVIADAGNSIPENDEENNLKILRVVVGYTLTLEIRPPDAGGDVEWWININGVNETYVGIGEFQIGIVQGSNTVQIQPVIYVNPSSRCVFRQWGDGVVSNPRTIEVSSDVALSTDFSLQYLLTLDPSGGITSPSGWYDSGAVVTLTATSPSNIVEKQSRLLFSSWSGDVQSESSTVSINMTRPYNVTANWRIQYYLQVVSPFSVSGEGWYDANAQAAISLTSPLTTDNGTRRVFVEWSGDVSGKDASQQLVMTGPKVASAIWATEYELNVESEYGHVNGSGWYVDNSEAAFAVDTSTIDEGNGTRRTFSGWSGDFTGTDFQSTVLMDAPKTVRATWGTQYEVEFVVRGLRNETSVTLVVDDESYEITVPDRVTMWVDAGSSLSFSTNTTITEAFRRYVLTDWKNSTGGAVESPQDVMQPEKYTAVYKELSLFPCIIATATFGSEKAEEVQYLRGFRDQLVLSTRAGKAFMSVFNLWYYSFSPQVANFIANHDSARTPLRISIYPLISILGFSSVIHTSLAYSPELAIVAAGFVASALIGLVYLTFVDICIVRFLPKRGIRPVHVLKVFGVSCLFALVMVLTGETMSSFELLQVGTSFLVLSTFLLIPLLFSLGFLNLCKRTRDFIRSKSSF